MSGSSQAAIMTARVEACFRQIRAAMAPARLALNEADVFTDHRAVLDSIRLIKAKAIEAEALIRAAYYRRDPDPAARDGTTTSEPNSASGRPRALDVGTLGRGSRT